MKSLNDLGPTVVEYVVTGRITWGHLVGDDIPSWRRELFGDYAEAKHWTALNGGELQWVVLPVIKHSGAPIRNSIRNHLDSMGAPEPARSLGREIDDFFKHGAASVDGDVFLDPAWHFDEVKRQRGRRLRMLDIDSQLRNEIVALEDAYRTVHGQLPPAVYWRSRQVCEELLLAAEKHRDEHNRLSPANERAWTFYEWRVDGLSAYSNQAMTSGAIPETPGGGAETVGQWIKRNRLFSALSQEDLSAQVGIRPRQVRRHESGNTIPNAENMQAYESTFSAKLGREVVRPDSWLRSIGVPETEQGPH